MAEQAGHAAFHLKHVTYGTSGNRADRRSLLHESMRHLDPKDMRRYAKQNRSIVPADAHLNTAFVNDGAGGFRVADKIKEVIDYGDAREKRVRRKINEKQVTTNLFVVHLPKSMCVEMPNYYPRLNEDGHERLDPVTGKVMSRSRWVARDRGEAMKYFQDSVAYLAGNVVPGGQEAIHGWATNFDESTPHIQIMADPFAPDPKAPDDNPDALRTEHNQAYGSHREIRDDDGRQISGPAKMRSYQTGFREHMVALGYPVELEVSERHGQELPLAEFQQAQDNLAEARREVESVRAWNRSLDEQEYDLAGQRRELRERAEALDVQEAAQNEREGILDRREAELPALRRAAVIQGRKTGFDAERDAAKVRADELLKTSTDELRAQPQPVLFDEFLDLKDPKGRSRRPAFERFVGWRLKKFEAEHAVTDDLILEPGDREQFIADGGERLAAEVVQLQGQQQLGG